MNKRTYSYDYARPALTVDCVVFGRQASEAQDAALKVLLVQRDLTPFKGKWALPGGFVHMNETLEQAALRQLGEETGVSRMFLEQLYTFGALKRDPRERMVSVAYFALVNLSDHRVAAATDARQAAWVAVAEVPTLAFDHQEILKIALQRLRGKVRYEPIGFELLPRKFTLTQLQRLYEAILETVLDKRNFRKKIHSMGVLVETDEVEQDVAHRAARLYKFDERKYRRLRRSGLNFEL